jgi:hypothetical protein
MKTRISLAGALMLMLVSLVAGPVLADGAKGVTVSPLTPKPDQVITVNGELLGPNSVVEVLLIGNGETVDLGEVKANEEGTSHRGFACRPTSDREPTSTRPPAR